MKLGKKTTIILSFTVGASVFLSTAFADVMIGSGYDWLKGSAKQTATQMEEGLNNYTIEALITMKDNDRTFIQVSTFQKINNEKQASESATITQQSNGETSNSYSYSDRKLSIWKSEAEDKYYVTEYPDGMSREDRKVFDSPFNEEGAPEIEKIVDALVGNLKEHVQAEERPEGGRVYSGSLSEAQVPALVNAVSSFGIKQMILEESRREKGTKLPEIESDIFVKKVSGTAVENKSGLLENVTGEIILTGKDKNGVDHDLTLDVVFKLSDIGNTKISKPDLNGANVETVSHSGFSSKYVGTYRNNIVIEKDGEFVKIGERTLEITSVESDRVTGKYYESVKPGFEAEYPDPYNFTFEYNPDHSQHMSLFTYTNAKGEQENGQLHPSGSGKLYLDLNVEIIDENSYRSNSQRYYDGEFDRVFTE